MRPRVYLVVEAEWALFEDVVGHFISSDNEALSAVATSKHQTAPEDLLSQRNVSLVVHEASRIVFAVKDRSLSKVRSPLMKTLWSISSRASL